MTIAAPSIDVLFKRSLERNCAQLHRGNGKLSMSWNDCVEQSKAIWGDHAWRHELKMRCKVVDRTINRWEKRGEIKGPVVAMLDAFLRLRKHNMTLPADDGLAP